MKDWWSKESLSNFNKRATCFVNQFSRFETYGMKVSVHLFVVFSAILVCAVCLCKIYSILHHKLIYC